MKIKLAVIVLLAAIFLIPGQAGAQQWSSDPVVDRMKKAEAAILDYEAFEAYCEKNPHETKCDGFRENPASKFVPYDDALRVGEQRKTEAQKPITLGEVARQARIQKLAKQFEPAIAEFCNKHATERACKEATPAEIAYRLAARKVLTPNVQDLSAKAPVSNVRQKDHP
jgi:hypothetical protein